MKPDKRTKVLLGVLGVLALAFVAKTLLLGGGGGTSDADAPRTQGPPGVSAGAPTSSADPSEAPDADGPKGADGADRADGADTDADGSREGRAAPEPAPAPGADADGFDLRATRNPFAPVSGGGASEGGGDRRSPGATQPG